MGKSKTIIERDTAEGRRFLIYAILKSHYKATKKRMTVKDIHNKLTELSIATNKRTVRNYMDTLETMGLVSRKTKSIKYGNRFYDTNFFKPIMNLDRLAEYAYHKMGLEGIVVPTFNKKKKKVPLNKKGISKKSKKR